MNKLSQQTADEILAEALSNINLYFGDAIIPDVPDGFSTRKKRFSKRFAQILNALVSEDKCSETEHILIECPHCKEPLLALFEVIASVQKLDKESEG